MAKISLADISTRAPAEAGKEDYKNKTAVIIKELDELQNLLYAENKHSVLIILQGMDASGKDGVIRNVLGHMNPMGVAVKSYKVPTAEEASHDFLWRIHRNVPAKGMIQVFNRSHYEDVLITRVHGLCDDATAISRMKAINDFEELLQLHNNTRILKFYLHVSPREQEKRLHERIHDPKKQWKYNEKDFSESNLWDTYMKVYEDCFERCALIPWQIIPADQNWYKEYLIAKTIRDTLVEFNMQYPVLKK